MERRELKRTIGVGKNIVGWMMFLFKEALEKNKRKFSFWIWKLFTRRKVIEGVKDEGKCIRFQNREGESLFDFHKEYRYKVRLDGCEVLFFFERYSHSLKDIENNQFHFPKYLISSKATKDMERIMCLSSYNKRKPCNTPDI